MSELDLLRQHLPARSSEREASKKAAERLGIDLAHAHPLSLRFEDYAVTFEFQALFSRPP